MYSDSNIQYIILDNTLDDNTTNFRINISNNPYEFQKLQQVLVISAREQRTNNFMMLQEKIWIVQFLKKSRSKLWKNSVVRVKFWDY